MLQIRNVRPPPMSKVYENRGRSFIDGKQTMQRATMPINPATRNNHHFDIRVLPERGTTLRLFVGNTHVAAEDAGDFADAEQGDKDFALIATQQDTVGTAVGRVRCVWHVLQAVPADGDYAPVV